MRMVILAFIFLFPFFAGCIGEEHYVVKVIDGDTIELDGGERVRLVGINTPEKGEPCYDEARLFLEGIVLGKRVSVVNYGRDRYGRMLGEIYASGKNVNLLLLEEGLAVSYYGESVAWDDYLLAEAGGFESGGCVWERGPFYGCVYVERVGATGFVVVNGCNVTIVTNTTIRDTSASNRFHGQIIIPPYGSITINEECLNDEKTVGICKHIFNTAGDQLIIYDGNGLIARYMYGVYG